jgi:hypothetical protein
VISDLKPVRTALPPNYRLISLLDTIGKIIEKILLAKVLHEISECGLLNEKQFGFKAQK